ncbi:hypothetical protein ATK30_6849 [Amycolatopsis echigonensis]|uniref:Phage Mu protein F like protein n=1 Tax=Amycolatopsis echigonensis TaxID=2576905 RepID=A0A2N3WPV4_9PSEU|nr:hypothetical protein [Amycolatopsis niigatensis]PKV95916.1 hypothetical protein ATK30_6849 [Amycolatopsis niigatensis]
MSSATSPPPRPPSDSVVPPLIFRHDAEALALEDEAARMAAGPLRNQLDDMVQEFRLRWVREFGTLRTKGDGSILLRLLHDLAQALSGVSFDPHTALLDYATRAQQLGVTQGFTEAGLEAADLPTPLPLATHTYVAGVVAAARDKVATAARIAPTLTGTFNQTVVTAATPAQHAANIVDRAARTLTNEHLNQGITTVADQVDGTPLWIAERDACVHCLALSGHTPGPDGLFDASATFGKHPLGWLPEGGLTGPPRHPRCRCRITIWFGHDTAGAESITHDWAGAIAEARANGDVVAEQAAHTAAAAARRSAAYDLPAALRREAERSVLKGWALPSEPDSVRTDAADRLLTRITNRAGYSPSGWKVPASVKKQTQRRIDKGTHGATPFPPR